MFVYVYIKQYICTQLIISECPINLGTEMSI